MEFHRHPLSSNASSGVAIRGQVNSPVIHFIHPILLAKVFWTVCEIHYADAFALITRDRPDALFAAYHPNIYAHRQLIADFALEQRIPAIFPYREAVMLGALMSYSVSATEQFRRAAGIIDKILKGAKPADIPVERPTRLELLINLKTAKAINFAFPPSFLALVDEVIE
jgi:putative tryptophan/tyrosine transport system substrate-binding protein